MGPSPPVSAATVTVVSVVIMVMGWQTDITCDRPQGGRGTVYYKVRGWEERGKGEVSDGSIVTGGCPLIGGQASNTYDG